MFIPWHEVQICQELPLGWLQAAFVSVKSVQTSGPRELMQKRVCDPRGFLRRPWAEWGPGGRSGGATGHVFPRSVRWCGEIDQQRSREALG